MEKIKEVLKIVVVGHVDHGKSTVVGRLLYDTKSLPKGTIDRVKRISEEKGKPFEYAYLLDAFEEEQKQGITIDTTQLQFFTEKRDYVIIDAPGHKEFLKNMISGAANAEAALLIIDANEGIQEQSKRHGYILSLLGIQKIYVIVNKIDLIDYSEEKFNGIKDEMNLFLNSLGVYPLKYIPISAFYGDNLARKSENTAWYTGESVLEALDLFEKDTGLVDKPLRFPIQDVYKFDSRRIIAGRIEAGSLKIGDDIFISPGNKTTKVKSIEYWAEKDKTDTVNAGMSVGITVEDEFFNKRGEVISHKATLPITAQQFKANIFWMGKAPLIKGKKYKLKLTTQEVECELISINKVIDATTLQTISDSAEVKTNDVSEVSIRTKEKIVFDKFKNNQITGRFVIVDGYDVCGGGIISGIDKEQTLRDRLVKNELSIEVNLFDEYYISLPENNIIKYCKKPETYGIDKILPVAGETYKYPTDFDIIDVKEGIVGIIRELKLFDLVEIIHYNFSDAHKVDKNGFGIKIVSENDLKQYINDSKNKRSQVEFSNNWLDVTKYRTIKFNEYESNIDWNI